MKHILLRVAYSSVVYRAIEILKLTIILKRQKYNVYIKPTFLLQILNCYRQTIKESYVFDSSNMQWKQQLSFCH